MVKLKPGDTVVCVLKDGRIVSSYTDSGEEKDFEIIALDLKGYFLYVPEYYNVSGTKKITPANSKSLKIDKRFMDCQMIYISDSLINHVKQVMDGLSCCVCKEFYKYSQANQEDGTLKCWRCRTYKYYS